MIIRVRIGIIDDFVLITLSVSRLAETWDDKDGPPHEQAVVFQT